MGELGSKVGQWELLPGSGVDGGVRLPRMGTCVARALIISGVGQPIASKNLDNLKPPPNSDNKSGSKIR